MPSTSEAHHQCFDEAKTTNICHLENDGSSRTELAIEACQWFGESRDVLEQDPALCQGRKSPRGTGRPSQNAQDQARKNRTRRMDQTSDSRLARTLTRQVMSMVLIRWHHGSSAILWNSSELRHHDNNAGMGLRAFLLMHEVCHELVQAGTLAWRFPKIIIISPKWGVNACFGDPSVTSRVETNTKVARVFWRDRLRTGRDCFL